MPQQISSITTLAPYPQAGLKSASDTPSSTSVKSIGLTTKVREIIEQGPPEELVSTFRKLFNTKIEETKALAVQAAKRYNLLPGLI